MKNDKQMKSDGIYNVRDFGAVGVAVPGRILKLEVLQHVDWFYPKTDYTVYELREGAELDSLGIQRAIDAAHADGGGTVVVPPGDYLIGPIRLRSNIELHLSPGARLWGSPVLEHYYGVRSESDAGLAAIPRGTGDLSGDGSGRTISNLIFSSGAENISFTGRGQISGQGPHFFIPWLNRERQGPLHRPKEMIVFENCRNVLVRDVFIRDSTYWTLVFHDCLGVRVDGVQMHHFDGPNCDGIDLSGTSEAIISNCRLHVTDDAICIKNLQPENTVRNVVVTNCLLRTLCNGIKIGSETLGSFEDITVSNIVIANEDGDVCDAMGGININCLDGGSVRRINVSNVVMRNVRCPFYLFNSRRSKLQKPLRTPQVGVMEDISISHIQATNTRYTSFVVGHPESPIRNLRLDNITLRRGREFLTQIPKEPVPEKPEAYPEPWIFDELPAHGLYTRHVQGFEASRLRLLTDSPDARPALLEENSIL